MYIHKMCPGFFICILKFDFLFLNNGFPFFVKIRLFLFF